MYWIFICIVYINYKPKSYEIIKLFILYQLQSPFRSTFFVFVFIFRLFILITFSYLYICMLIRLFVFHRCVLSCIFNNGMIFVFCLLRNIIVNCSYFQLKNLKKCQKFSNALNIYSTNSLCQTFEIILHVWVCVFMAINDFVVWVEIFKVVCM